MAANPPFHLIFPFKWKYFITDRFNAPRNYTFAPHKLQKHEGLDFAPVRPITQPLEVLAAQRGIVSKVGFNGQGYGNYVRIDHDWFGEKWVTWYGHMERTLTTEGTFVNAGDVIGIAGNTGFSTGLHLHLTLQHIGHGLANYVVDDVVDPEPFLAASLPPFDEASWVEDVTIKDGTIMRPGQTFTKTWRIRNSGNKAWIDGYQFMFSSGTQMGGPASVPLKPAQPGQTVEVTVNLKAPDAPGTYRSNWQGRAPDGKVFDFLQWVEIVVQNQGGITPTPAGRSELGYVEDVTIPDGTEFRPGEQFVKTWKVKNNGTTTWGDGYLLGFFSGDRMSGPESQPLPPAAPGEEVNISVRLTAPASPGVYRSTWKPRTPDGKFFDHEQWAEIKVVGQALANEASLIADGFSVQPGDKFIKTWRVRNTGQSAWGQGYSLVFSSGQRMGGAENVPLTPAQPGEEVAIAILLTAPETAGVHKGTWRLRGARGDLFGPMLEAVVFVTPG